MRTNHGRVFRIQHAYKYTKLRQNTKVCKRKLPHFQGTPHPPYPALNEA